jgi:phosphoribulokinase
VRARPILIGIAGDSAAGKTTLTRGLVRTLGSQRVTHVAGDDYHRYTRAQRHARDLTPLHPDANFLDILEQQVEHLRNSEPILKPVYHHQDGEFGAAEYIEPTEYTVVEGMLTLHQPRLRELFDVRVFLDPPEKLRRHWKLERDCSRRGYTTDQVFAQLDRREDDAAAYIRPQRVQADIVISFMPRDDGPVDPTRLDARVTLRSGLIHPDLSTAVEEAPDSLLLEQHGNETILHISGLDEPADSAPIQEALWDGMHFASHLHTERLGEFTTGTELHRSETLAMVQLLLLHHLVNARAAVAIGAASARTEA